MILKNKQKKAKTYYFTIFQSLQFFLVICVQNRNDKINKAA